MTDVNCKSLYFLIHGMYPLQGDLMCLCKFIMSKMNGEMFHKGSNMCDNYVSTFYLYKK